MVTQRNVHTLILGSGPSGLAAGYVLAKAGLKPVILERDKVSGGLMRSIRRGDFIVDVGRKELYNRLAPVEKLWSELLGSDYRTYSRRAGILYDGMLLDMSPTHKGFRRGMPWSLVFGCGWDFLRWRAGLEVSTPRNLEEFWYKQRGRLLTKIANQGFHEKLSGQKWSEIPLPNGTAKHAGTGFIDTVRQAMARAFTEKEVYTVEGIWRHPAKGTGQICEYLERGIVQHGGDMLFQASSTEMRTSDDRIESVVAQVGGETIEFRPSYVVPSTPVEILERDLIKTNGASAAPSAAQQHAKKRVLVLVYLFFNEEPRFPHVWLHVTCPKTRIGRITNYAAMNGDMVPKGKTAISCEYYCYGEDPLLKLSDKEIGESTLRDLAANHLADAGKCIDTMVLRFPGADASQGRHNWLNKARQSALLELRRFKNLFPVNRADLDIATLAGIDAAEAIIKGDRSTFDLHTDPIQLGIQKTSKPLDFSPPPGVVN